MDAPDDAATTDFQNIEAQMNRTGYDSLAFRAGIARYSLALRAGIARYSLALRAGIDND